MESNGLSKFMSQENINPLPEKTNMAGETTIEGPEEAAERKKSAAFYELPEDATWEAINQRSKEWDEEAREFSEEERKRLALVLGLPEDAGWGAINAEQRDMEENIHQRTMDEMEDRRQRGL